MLKSNIHTHTQFCDGKNTMEEMVRCAIDGGFVSLGFSPHASVEDQTDWTMSAEGLPKYFAEIERLQKVYGSEIEILCGIEADTDSGIPDGDFTYVIGGVHRMAVNGRKWTLDYSSANLQECIDVSFGSDPIAMAEFYFDYLANFIIDQPRVDVVAHFDLITKFAEQGLVMDTADPRYVSATLGAIDRITKARPGIIFEVNIGAMYRAGRKEPYPQLFILKHIHACGSPVTITSDAHDTVGLSASLDMAVELCRSAGFESLLRLRQSGWEEVGIRYNS